jgi:hypothetical protein
MLVPMMLRWAAWALRCLVRRPAVKWYTLVASLSVGDSGRVLAFEPNPDSHTGPTRDRQFSGTHAGEDASRDGEDQEAR